MAIVLSLCAAYVAYCLGTNPAGPITTPDSLRYLEHSPIYPLGYPAFLALTGARGAIIFQPIIFAAALAYLGREIVVQTRQTWLAAVVVLASMALPQIREFHASILSESLFLSLGVVLLALSVRFAYHPSWHLLVPIAIAAGLAATVRRTGFSLLPVMLILVVAQRHRLKGSQAAFFCVAALAPFFAIIGVEQAVAPIVHHGHQSSLMGRHMFAKAALIDAPAAPSSGDSIRTVLDHHLQSDYAPIRALLSSAPREIRAVLSIYYETCLQGDCVDRSRAVMPGLDESAQTRTLGDAGLARIRRAPLAFLDLMALNYASLWTVDRLHYPGRAEALTAFVAAHRPMPFEELAFRLQPGQPFEFQPSSRVRYQQWVITVLAIWTAAIAIVGGIAALGSRLSPPFAIATTAAFAAHGGLLLTALLAAGFSRFTIGVWPAIVTAAAVGLSAAFQKLKVKS